MGWRSPGNHGCPPIRRTAVSLRRLYLDTKSDVEIRKILCVRGEVARNFAAVNTETSLQVGQRQAAGIRAQLELPQPVSGVQSWSRKFQGIHSAGLALTWGTWSRSWCRYSKALTPFSSHV